MHRPDVLEPLSAPVAVRGGCRRVLPESSWIGVGELDEQSLSVFLASQRASGVRRVRTADSLGWLLAWLESQGKLSPCQRGLSWPDAVLAFYSHWLGKSSRAVAEDDPELLVHGSAVLAACLRGHATGRFGLDER